LSTLNFTFPTPKIPDRQAALARLIREHGISWPGTFYPVQVECSCGVTIVLSQDTEETVTQGYARHLSQVIDRALSAAEKPEGHDG
jgi:hypothetical protein